MRPSARAVYTVEMRLRTAVALLPVLLAFGCNEERVVTELDSACVTPADAETLAVEVFFSGCISASCETLESSSCQLTREGEAAVRVSGEALISGPPRQLAGCNADCQIATATCTIDLAPGDYTLVGANEEIALVHPVVEELGVGCDVF